MAKIYIIRHGQDADNSSGILNGHRDMQLTDLGRQQAGEMAKKLKDANIQVIYTSPLIRASETASIISRMININKVVTCNQLIERNFGILTGKLTIDIPKYANKIIVSDDVQYFIEADGIEDFPSLYVRASKVLERIMLHHFDGNALIVCHGDIGKMLRAAFYNWSWEEGLLTSDFKHNDIIELINE
ncbi:MAG: histidine phosphatase family protein [Candidatus Pacebacteria bacterium]|nr:histidine phosphatase family protein [Candidatus Paceibacterota bacterium]